MKKCHSPVWPEAPRRNTVMVCLLENTADLNLVNSAGRPLEGRVAEVGYSKLARWRDLFSIIGEADIDSVSRMEVTSKPDLVTKVKDFFRERSAGYPLLSGSIDHAALAGAGVIAAYLEMIAQVQSKINPNEFDEETFYSSVRASRATILDMTGRSEKADAALTSTIMKWSPREVAALYKAGRGDEVYTHLSLNHAYFDIDEASGTVALKKLSEIGHTIKTFEGKCFDLSQNNKEVLLGCPFRSKIMGLYYAMADAMVNNGIARETYAIYKGCQMHENVLRLGEKALISTSLAE